MTKDHRVEIEAHKAPGLGLSFFFSWDKDRYGVSANAGKLRLEEKFLNEPLPGPELPDKRLCETFWKAFTDFAKGDDYYAPVFAPRPAPEARSWGRSEMARMRLHYDAWTANPWNG